MNRITGVYEPTTIAGEVVSAFLPKPLPPVDPPLELDAKLASRLGAAASALQRLDTARDYIPSIEWFLYAFVRKEAVITSQIEGTQSTLVDLLQFESEASDRPEADLREVCNYLDALEYARKEIARPGGLPISVRLLNGAHKRLMRGVRGASKQPGEVRRSQNWIGGSRPGNAVFVPPPPSALPDALTELERYLHSGEGAPYLVRAGLAHAQFETIHPYVDGNGRIGRLLIALLLEQWGLLRSPLLYVSLHFKRHRAEYYRRLERIRTDGDWEGWLDFFLDGVARIAEEALATARDLSRMISEDRERVLGLETTSVVAVRLFDLLPRHPIVSAKSVVELLGVSKPTAGRALEHLVRSGVLVETSGRRRDRRFAYDRYVELLRAGTD
ncbi:MAG TPA: Fic family protein [Candidatus Eisenbacteria bacterium]|nr:Fic family protein [Candidatus Eisenbacteria bacterium]